jgi:cytochrome oxidase Cu insertion factor (SCO1/SenC/PrrC family)
MKSLSRQRLKLLLVLLLFAAPVLVGIVLVSFGWMPGTKSYGLPILPQRNVASVPVHLDNGRPFTWRDRSFHWTLVALPGPDCSERCMHALDMIHRARITLNQHSDQLRLLYLGTPPQGDEARMLLQPWTVAQTPSHAFDDLRPGRRDSLAAVLVMPDGVALTHYPAGFDANGLKKDLHKVIR